MDDKDLEILKAAIKAIIEAHIDGQVPFAYVSAVVLALVSALGVTWNWGLSQSKKSAEEVLKWATRVEEINNAQRDRDDARDKAAREQWQGVILEVKDEYREQIIELKKTQKRTEDARDMIRTRYDAQMEEGQKLLLERISENTAALCENGESLDLLLPLMKGINDGV